MKEERSRPERRSIWRRLERWTGYILPLAGLAYIFHDIKWKDLASGLISVRWPWLAAGVAAVLLSFIFQALQWRYLLFAAAKIPLRMAVKSVFAGQFANELLPMRMGELFRAYLVATWTGRPFAATIPSALALRVLDGFWLALGVWLAELFVDLPRILLVGASVLAFILLLGSGLLAYGLMEDEPVLAKWKEKKQSRSLLAASERLLGILTIGLKDIVLKSPFYLAQAAALLFLVLQIASFWLMLLAYRIQAPIAVAVAVFLILHIGVLLPSTPGSFGIYQFFCVVGLVWFGVPKTTAAGFSLVAYFFLKAPVWLVGFAVLTRTGIPMRSIAHKIEELR